VVTPAGETIAAWVRLGIVEVAVRPPGGAFGSPVPVSYAGADPTAAPDLAVANDGRVLLTWSDHCDQNRGTCVAEAIIRNPGGAFGAPVTLSDAGAGNPRGAFTSDGRAVVVWERQAAIEAAIAPPVGGFSGKGDVVGSSAVDVSSPDIATDAAGNAYVAWAATTPGGSSGLPGASLWLAQSPRGSSGFSAPSELRAEDSAGDPSSGDVISYASTAIAVDHAGNAAVAWIRSQYHYDIGPPAFSVTYPTLQVLGRTSDGTVNPPQNLDSGISVGGSGVSITVRAASLAVDDSGDVVAVWSKRDSSNATTAIREAVRPAGVATFGRPTSPVSGQNDTAPDSASVSITALGPNAFLLGFVQAGMVRAATARADGVFGNPVAISPVGAGLSVPSFAGDTDGDAVGAWPQLDSNGIYRTQVAAYDATPPELRQVEVPSRAVVGQSVVFAASPFDTWSGVGANWNFGDGTPDASGNSVPHVFERVGDFTVTLTATDGLGNTSVATRSVTVTSTDHKAPKVTHLRLTRARFAIAKRATAVSAVGAHRGTTIRFTLSEPATVRLYIKRVLTGHRRGKRCSAKAGSGRPCSVYRAAGKLVRSGRKGARKVPFTGRIGAHALRPGHYRLSVIAKDAGGNTSKPARARFTIVRG
jgi:hypothetical protein